MRVALSIMLMQECCNFICQWENEPGGVPIRIKHLLHSSAGEIFQPCIAVVRQVPCGGPAGSPDNIEH